MNEQVLRNTAVTTDVMELESAIATGAKFAGIAEDLPVGVKTYVEDLWRRPAYQRAAAVK